MPSEAYKKRAFQIAQEQIALAGYRLGEMLNQIFGGQELTREEYDKNRDRYLKEVKEGSRVIGTGANDAWLWMKTRAALLSANDLRESTINVDVENGVVTLKGTVPNRKQKEIAVKAAKGIEGVKDVKDMLKVMSGNFNK